MLFLSLLYHIYIPIHVKMVLILKWGPDVNAKYTPIISYEHFGRNHYSRIMNFRNEISVKFVCKEMHPSTFRSKIKLQWVIRMFDIKCQQWIKTYYYLPLWRYWSTCTQFWSWEIIIVISNQHQDISTHLLLNCLFWDLFTLTSKPAMMICSPQLTSHGIPSYQLSQYQVPEVTSHGFW